MVSSLVEIKTKSYQDDMPAVHWTCDGSTEFKMKQIDKADRIGCDTAGDLQIPVLNLSRSLLQSDMHRPVHADDRRHQRCQEHQHFQRYAAQQFVILHLPSP